MPVTALPSAHPSITGEIISVTLGGTVDEELSQENLTAIAQQIVDAYGVDADDVQLETIYTTSGEFDVDIPNGVSEEEALERIQQSLSELLGVHPKDIDVKIHDGKVFYEISGGNFTDVNDILEKMSDPEFSNNFTEEIQKSIPGLEVTDVTPESSIEVEVKATIDATDADPQDDADESLEQLGDDLGLNIRATSKDFKTFFFQNTILFFMFRNFC